MLALMRNAWSNPGTRIAVLFGVYLAFLAFLYPTVRSELAFAFRGLETLTARLQVQVLGLLTDDVSHAGRLVVFRDQPGLIIEECTGLSEMLIFAATVLAFPTRFRNKLVGLAFGLPLIYAFNVLRISALLLVGRHRPAWSDFMHLYFWQGTLILMILGTWLLWILLVVRRDAPADSHA
jgi:archaeosortase B (VPXXXP-CTERM-specific)